MQYPKMADFGLRENGELMCFQFGVINDSMYIYIYIWG
jgi:hypothetical protein